MELAVRRSGPGGRDIALIWRGGEHARGKKRAAEISGGAPIEGKAVVHDAIAGKIEALPHGSIVTADCAFQSGRGFVAARIVSIERFEASVDHEEVLGSLVKSKDWKHADAYAREHDDALTRSPKLLSLAVEAYAGAGHHAEAERSLTRLLDANATVLAPVYRAVEALGNRASDDTLRRIVALYVEHGEDSDVFKSEIPPRLWPPALQKKHAAAQAKLAALATEHAAAARAWAKTARTPAGSAKTVKLTAANLRDLGMTDAVRKKLLATAIPVRVAPLWRATFTKTKTLAEQTKGHYTIGKDAPPPTEQIGATIAIDLRGRVFMIVDDGDGAPEVLASSLEVFVARLEVVRSYIAASVKLVGKSGRSTELESAAREVLKKIEPRTMVEYWDPVYAVAES